MLYFSEEIIEIPTKCVESMKQVVVKATIQYIDFEGRSDGESLLKIVSQLKARNVICLRGDVKAVNTLRYYNNYVLSAPLNIVTGLVILNYAHSCRILCRI